MDTNFKKFLSADSDVLMTLMDFVQKGNAIPNPDKKGPTGSYPHFFISILGSDFVNSKANSNELTSNQQEILTALLAKRTKMFPQRSNT